MLNKIYDKIKKFTINNYDTLLIILVGLILLFVRLPYVVYTPGGTIDLSDRIVVEEGYDTEGSFNMAYVNVFNGTIPAVLLSFILPNWDLEKAEDITLEGQTLDELNEYNKLQMQTALDSATIVSYLAADKEIDIEKNIINVGLIMPYAETDLEVGDIVLKIDGVSINDMNKIISFIDTKEIGDEVSITVLRNDKNVKTTSIIQEEDGEKKIGIAFITTYEFDIEPDLDIEIESDESGPSGGLMLTLGIYNSLTEDDITKGREIVGTGTIEADGTVGEISGVKYKVLGSKDADIFLCPEENYEEAVKTVEENDLDIEVISVISFADALLKLN